MNEFLQSFADFLRTLWLQADQSVPLILFALLSFIAGLYIARIANALVSRGLRYRKADPEITLLAGRIVQWTIIIFGVLFATQQIGVDITAFLTGIGILGFTIGFALQDVSKNFVSGMLILMTKPFSLRDVIEVAGFNGTVLDITLRDTVLRTADGLRVRIPNGEIFTRPILNFSRLARRRIQLTLGVDYNSNLEKVRKVATETIRAIPGVLEDPSTEVFFESFGEFAIQMRVFYWYDERKTNYVKALDAGVSGLKRAFDEAKIRIPVPFRELRLMDGHQSWRKISDIEPEPSTSPQLHREANGSTK